MRYTTALIMAMLVLCFTSALADEIDEEANAAEAREWLSNAAAAFASGEHEGLPLYSAKIMEQLPPLEEFREREGWCSYVNCCAPVIDLYASSSLEDSAGLKYDADQCFDFDYTTAWVEGVEGNGVGQSLEFTFRTHGGENMDGGSYQQQYVNGLEIVTGYAKSQALHLANACPLLLKVSLNGVPACVVDLQDSMDIQEVSFPPLYLSGEYDPVITLEIIGVRDGKKYADAAISEIDLRGGPCH
ncbi:hypothetical protein KDL29_10660 [bacterium]|nr:hypothetical protein [bacterium]